MKFIIKLAIVIVIIFLDLAGTFSNSDLPFLSILILIQSGRKVLYSISLFLLIFMGLSYFPTGTSVVTERIGEWFYLFFLCSLIIDAYEMYRLRK